MPESARRVFLEKSPPKLNGQLRKWDLTKHRKPKYVKKIGLGGLLNLRHDQLKAIYYFIFQLLRTLINSFIEDWSEELSPVTNK